MKDNVGEEIRDREGLTKKVKELINEVYQEWLKNLLGSTVRSSVRINCSRKRLRMNGMSM